MLTYKARLVGIEVILTEESYTSIASALDGDQLPSYNGKTQLKLVFSGQRVQRGLYQTSTGRTINADTNGSINIARIVIPNFMDGIEEPVRCGGSPRCSNWRGLPFIPVVLDLWTKIANVYV